MRDRSFYCRIDDNTEIYAIFSGHQGSKVANYALQRMAAEIVLGQLYEKSSEEEVKEVLRQACIAVEKAYQDSIDVNLTRKFMLQSEIPEGLNQYEVSQGYQSVLDELNAIHEILSVGCSVVLALIYKGKLYLMNVGNCKALLCKNDAHNVLRVVQLSVDHNLNNQDEAVRLQQLGLDVQGLSDMACTRCIGNYLGKGGYKDCEYLSAATSEPITSQPEIVGGFPIDDSCRFLMLLGSGLVNALDDIYAGDALQSNKEIVQMVVEQFRTQSTLAGVAQSVVHKAVQFHHDTYMEKTQHMEGAAMGAREDLTLLVRNFNFPMPNAIQKRPSQVRFDAEVKHRTLVSTMNSGHSSEGSQECVTPTNASINSNNSSIAGLVGRPLFTRADRGSNGSSNRTNDRIKPYVDFSGFAEQVERARQMGTLPKNIDFD